MNVRSDNTTKQENVGRLGNLSSLVSDKKNEAIRNKVNLNPGPYRDLLLNEFRLKYYNDNNKVFHGEQVVSEVDKQLLQNLRDGLKEHEVIAYIGDINSQRATDLKNLLGDKLVLVSPNDVQGEEYKYTIVDTDWNPIDASMNLTSFTNELAKLYTLLSRSSVGSFIINNNFQLKSERVNQSHEIELNQEDLGGYKEFLSQILPLALVSAQSSSVPESTQAVGVIKITGDPIASDSEPSKQFLNKHAQVFTHFKTEVKGNEDLLGLNLEVNELRANTLLRFKQLLVNNTPLNELLDETTNQAVVDIFNTVHGNLGITKDQIKKGSYKLKVYPATSGDIIPEFGDSFNTGSKVVKLVYQIPMGTNTVDIVLGHVRNDVNNEVDNLKFGEGDTTAYYNINNPKFQNRKFELRRINSEFWNDRNNRESHTLDKIRNAHPELVITDPMIISNQDGTKTFDSKFNVVKDLNNVAKPIVLVSSDITLTKDQVLEKYITWLNNDCKTPLPDIGVLELKPKGFTSEEFFNLWKSTLVNNNPSIGKNDLNSLNAVYLGAKFLQTLDKFFKEPKTEDEKKVFAQATGIEFDDAKQAYTQQIYERFSDPGYGNSNRNPIVKIPTILEAKDLANTLSPEGQAHFKNVILSSYTASLKTKKESGIQTFIETLNTHKDDKELSAEDKDKIANVAKELQQALDDIDTKVVLENSGALFYTLLSNGILAPISTGAVIISRLSRMRDADSTLGKVIDYVLNTSPSFKFGIIVNPIASKGMFHQDKIFTQSGLEPDQFYVDAELYSQRTYFDSSNIESNNNPAPEPTNEIQVGTPDPVRVATDNSAILHQLIRDIDTNLYNLGLTDVSRILTSHLGTITNNITPEELVTQMNNLLDSWKHQVIYDKNGVPVDTFGNIRIKYADGKVSIAKLGDRYTEGNFSSAFTDYPRDGDDLLFFDNYGNPIAKVPEWEVEKFAFVSPNTFYLQLGNTSYKALYQNGTVTLTEEESPFELEQVDENCI